MEPVSAGAGGGSDPGLINGFVDRLPLNGLHIKSNCLRLTVHLRHGIVCTGRHAARHHHAGRAIPAIGNPSRGSRSTRSVTAWLKPPPIRAITDRWLHDSSDNSLDFHRVPSGTHPAFARHWSLHQPTGHPDPALQPLFDLPCPLQPLRFGIVSFSENCEELQGSCLATCHRSVFSKERVRRSWS